MTEMSPGDESENEKQNLSYMKRTEALFRDHNMLLVLYWVIAQLA